MRDKDFEVSAQNLAAVWDHAEREGVADPGVFPVAPDLVEALVEADVRDAARRVTARLADLAQGQNHPWALAGSRRSAAIVELADGPCSDESGRGARAVGHTWGWPSTRRGRCSRSAGRSDGPGSGGPRGRPWNAPPPSM